MLPKIGNGVVLNNTYNNISSKINCCDKLICGIIIRIIINVEKLYSIIKFLD